MQKNKIGFTGKKSVKVLSTIFMIFALVFAPFSMALNPGQGQSVVQKNTADAAGLADIQLLSGQSLNADYNASKGELSLNIKGLVLLNVGALTEQHFNYQLPSEFRGILENPNFKNAARIDYKQNLILGLLPISSGTLQGDDLKVDPAAGIVSGTRFTTLDLSVASNMNAKLVINLKSLGAELPSSGNGYLKFYGSATKSALVDLPLLSSQGASDIIATIENEDLSANPVTDKDTVITGIKKRSVGTSVRVFKGNQEIGRGEVKATKNQAFSAPIPQQPAGTELIVHIYYTNLDSSLAVGKPLTLVVADATAPDAPVVNPVTDQDTFVTGVGEAGAIVTVSSPSSDQSWTGQVDGTGNYSVAIAPQAGGTELAVTLTDATGNESEPTGVIVEDKSAPNAPEVNGVTDQDTVVTGSGEAGATVTVVTPDGSYNGTVNAEGEFSVEIPAQTAGTEIKVTLVDATGNVSEETIVVVAGTDTTAPDAPTVNGVTDADTVVTGNGEANATVTVVTPEGTYTDFVNRNGTFSVEIPAQKVGTEIKVTLTDDAGNVSEETIVVVSNSDVTAPNAPKVDGVNDKDRVVTGSGEANATVKVVAPGGTYTSTVDSKGKFIVGIPAQKAGTELKVTLTDAAGNESKVTKVIVSSTADVTAPDAPKVNGVTNHDAVVTGSGEADAKVTVQIKNGSFTGTVDKLGNYSVTIPKQAVGTEITVFLTDAAGNKSKGTTVKVTKAIDQIKINTVNVSDSVITGTADPSQKNVRLTVNGKVLRLGTINADGTYSIAFGFVLDEKGNKVKAKVGDVVKVDYTAAAHAKLAAETKVVADNGTKLSVDTVYVGEDFITGKANPGAKEVSLTVNGKLLRIAKIEADGTYKIPFHFVLDEQGRKVKPVIGDKILIEYKDKLFAGLSAETVVVPKKDDSNSISINKVTVGDQYITGTADKSATELTLSANGKLVRVGKIQSDGSFSIPISIIIDQNGNKVKPKAGDVLKLQYKDEYYSHISKEIVVVK